MASGCRQSHDDVWKDAKWRSRIRQRLLGWFADNARNLPWRNHPTPYHVWISEIMLQQTQVATVIPYYQRLLAAFPTIADLAAADQQELLGLWEGLGYYRRARSMHKAAQLIVERHGGIFPETYDDVIALPGIGRYTAGAILSISGDARLPVVEGNTQRVFSRLAAVRSAAGESSTTKLLWEIAESMLPRRGAGAFNQAAMELGALVCTPKNPQCDRCPVRSYCGARREGLQEEIPGKISRVRYEDRNEFALVIGDSLTDDAKFLLRPLPEGGRWAGLWDFPRTTNRSFDTVDLARAEIEDQLGIAVVTGVRLKTIKHAVTKYRISLHVHQARLARKLPLSPPWRFVSIEEMFRLPMSVTGRKIAKMLRDSEQAD